MSYCHLHTHSQYSIGDGRATVAQYVDLAKADGHSALALTDHGNMAGAIELYTLAKKAGIKPIIGSELYLEGDGYQQNAHITVLAANQRGYRDLIEITTAAHKNFYKRPRVKLADLTGNKKKGIRSPMENWVVLTGCIGGRAGRYILNDEYDRAVQYVKKLQEAAKAVFIEVMHHDSWVGLPYESKQDTFIEGLFRLAKDTGSRLVMTNDCHFHSADWEDWYHNLIAAAPETAKRGPYFIVFDARGVYFKTEEEMRIQARKASIPQEALDNTLEVAELCDLEIPEVDRRMWHVPAVVDDPCDTIGNMLRDWVESAPKEYQKRYEREMSVLGTAPHIAQSYLLTHEIVEWCRKENIPVTSRGSMAGSLISWLLGITAEDPIKYKLLFERAVNPARLTIPDFDLDVSSRQRGKVLAHIKQRYQGRQIVTFSTYGPRGAARFVMTCKGMSEEQKRQASKRLPEKWDGDWYKPAESVIGKEAAKRLEQWNGLIGNQGRHAAGIVLTDTQRPLEYEVPLMRIADKASKDVHYVTHFDMYSLKELGLFKLDILGVETLDSLQAIEAGAGTIVPNEYDDKAVYESFSHGLVCGLFQMKGTAARFVINQLKEVQDFNDVVAINAMVRPGAYGAVKAYKDGSAELLRAYPDLRDILEPTRGLVIYQEQVMEICKRCAGFDDIEQDTVKEAIKHFEGDTLDRLEAQFLAGCKANGIRGEGLWRAVRAGAGYNFNRAHAVIYAGLAYRMMWYKEHYPSHYYAAVFDTLKNKGDRLWAILESANWAMEWLIPDINDSWYRTRVRSDGRIRIGIGNISGIGYGAYKALKAVRPIKDAEDLRNRVERKSCNIGAIRALAAAGAFPGTAIKPAAFEQALDFPIELLEEGFLSKVTYLEDAPPIWGKPGYIIRGIPTNDVIQESGKHYIELTNALGSFRVIVAKPPSDWHYPQDRPEVWEAKGRHETFMDDRPYQKERLTISVDSPSDPNRPWAREEYFKRMED